MEDFLNRIDLSKLQNTVESLKNETSKVIVGQNKMLEQFLIAILADGHILIEGVPGIAKTLTAKLIAKSISADFSRIQFTPDLMPSDVLGTNIYNMQTTSFEFIKGPIFGNIILIDEINRAPAKTQAALFEVMEERQVTIDGTTYKMQPPFLVFATQNPIDHEGTYRLPEAQLDRFIFKIVVDYPNLEEENEILKRKHENKGKSEMDLINKFITAKEISEYQDIVRQIHVKNNILNYIAEIVTKTRNNSALYLGASPRASIALLITSKAKAAINGRDFVNPDDVKEMAYPVLRHRIILSPEKEMEGITPEIIIKNIIETVEVPR